jgi:hypothetical protein
MVKSQIPPFYKRYINLVDTGVLLHSLTENGKKMREYVGTWSEEMANYRYAPEKWRAREVIMHLNDAERVFAYRAMRFARKDKTILPGFDENAYALEYSFDKRSLDELIHEMTSIREATIALFSSFTDLQLKRKGTASQVSMSVQTIGEIIAGHELHHKNILMERYFPK